MFQCRIRLETFINRLSQILESLMISLTKQMWILFYIIIMNHFDFFLQRNDTIYVLFMKSMCQTMYKGLSAECSLSSDCDINLHIVTILTKHYIVGSIWKLIRAFKVYKVMFIVWFRLVQDWLRKKLFQVGWRKKLQNKNNSWPLSNFREISP